MKKICFIHSYGAEAFRKQSVGGTELQLYYISTALAENEDYRVDFITQSADEQVEGVNLVSGIGSLDNIGLKILSGLRMLYYMHKTDSDLYFSSSDNMIPGLVSFFCKLRGKKHIHRTVHERECDGSLIQESKIKGTVNYLGLKFADLVFVQCRDHEQLLSEWFDPDTRILPNSFPIPNKGEIGGDYILWVGRRVEWKKPELALKLAREFKSERFVIISPRTSSDEEYYNRIENEAEELSNVELIERVPRNKIQEYFDNAKIFLNTSEKEGFPNTFVEAGIGSTPILSYRVDPDSFIENNNCGFSSSGDYEELKSKLEYMLENEDQRMRQAENCREYVEENHDISKNIQKVKKQIERLLET